MSEREILKEEIQDNIKTILKLYSLNKTLKYQMYTISDLEQQYEEKLEMRSVVIDGEIKKVKTLIARIYWMRKYKDINTGEIIYLKTNKIVRIDGDWVVSHSWRPSTKQ